MSKSLEFSFIFLICVIWKTLPPCICDLCHRYFLIWGYGLDNEHAEVEFMVGPIPIDDGIGKEVVTMFSTSTKSNKTFYGIAAEHMAEMIESIQTEVRRNIAEPNAKYKEHADKRIHLKVFTVGDLVMMHSWRVWEDEAHMDRHGVLTEITRKITLQRQSTMVKFQASNPLVRMAL